MYEGFPGTSMAAPVVAGAAALLKAENPLFSPADIEAIITQSADKFKDMTFFVEDGNYLNLKEALTLAQTYQASSNASVDDPETTGPGSDASVDNSETTDSGPDTSVDDSRGAENVQSGHCGDIVTS